MSPTVLLILALSGSLGVDGKMASDTWANPLESLRRALRYWRDIYRTYQEEFELGYCWADYILGLEDLAMRAESQSMGRSPPKAYGDIMRNESTACGQEAEQEEKQEDVLLAAGANYSKVRPNFPRVTTWAERASDERLGMLPDPTVPQSAITVPSNLPRPKRDTAIENNHRVPGAASRTIPYVAGNNQERSDDAGKVYVNENRKGISFIELDFTPSGKILFHARRAPSFNLNSSTTRTETMTGVFVGDEERYTMPSSSGGGEGARKMENAFQARGENTTHVCGGKRCYEKGTTEEKPLLRKKSWWLVNVSFSAEKGRKLKDPRSMTETEEVGDNPARKRHIDSRVQTVYGEDLSAFEIPRTVRQESPYRHRSSRYDGPQRRGPLESLALADNTPQERHFDSNGFPSATNSTYRRHTLRRGAGKTVLEMLKDTARSRGRILSRTHGRISEEDKKYNATSDEGYNYQKFLDTKDHGDRSWYYGPNCSLSELLNRIFSRNEKIPVMKKNYANNGSNCNEGSNKQESLLGSRSVRGWRAGAVSRDHRGQQEAYRRGSLPVRKSSKKGKSMGQGESQRPRRSTSLAHFGDERFMGEYTVEAEDSTAENFSRGTSSSTSVDQGRPFSRTVLQARGLFETITPMIGLHPTFLGILRLLGMLISLGRRIMDAIETNKVLSCTWDYVSLRISRWIDSP